VIQAGNVTRRRGSRGKLPQMFKPLLAALIVLSACNNKDTPRSAQERSATPGATASDPKAPVARIGNEVITAGELDTSIKPQLARMEAEHAEQVHNLKSTSLDTLVDKKLIESKAKAEGITPEKLVEREVTSKIPTPSDAEVQAVYDRTKAAQAGQGRQLPPLDQLKGEIVNFIKERNSEQARKAFTDKLRAESKVTVLLPPLLLPKVEVAAEGQSTGDSKAPVTIVEFSDFQCPFCSRAEETVKKVLEDYKGKVRLYYRDYPLPFHDKAQKASEAALCAADQGKYWEMHGKLFANQSALAVPQLKEHAKGLGLDAGRFDKCLDSGEKAKMVEASKKAGDQAGVNGTPAFFINGRPLSGAVPIEKFKEIIDYELSAGG
jgi:predicted DsbA family dithiol-disulfide isomerase